MKMTIAERIIQSVCELQEMPPLDDPETLVVSVNDLRTIIENRLSRAVQIEPIELTALKKLAIINGALAKSISGTASIEQTALTRVLIDVVSRADIAHATA